jgi:hypothetical protein
MEPFILQGLDGVARRYSAAGQLLQAGTLAGLTARFPGEQVIVLRPEPAQVEEVRRLHALDVARQRPAGIQVAP